MWTIPVISEEIKQGDMPTDRIVFHPNCIKNANILFGELEKQLKKCGIEQEDFKYVISISGGSGSGKTSIASLLAFYLNKNGVKTYTHSGDNYPRRVPKINDKERMKRYETGGQKALEEYLGTPEEIDFEGINRVILAFKENKKVISLRRMGQKEEEIWQEDVDFSKTKILLIEWTHGSSEYLKGVDYSIFLQTTPAETKDIRIARGRDANASSPFMQMVIAMEQKKLECQKKSASLIMLRQGQIVYPKKQIRVMLNAYPDSMGGSLSSTVEVLKKDALKDAFSGFYILPSLFMSDLDRGFSVISYDLNKELAKEADLKEIQNMDMQLKLDFVMNHLSVNSPQFQDILNKGYNSEFADFFINWNTFWEGYGTLGEEGYIVPQDRYIKQMFFRKPGLPILMIPMPDGSKVPYWNTFYQEVLEEGKSYLGQMDLNLSNEKVWMFYQEVFAKLAAYGASIVRLDAFAYASKEVGKRNFLNEPDTWETLERIQTIADKYQVKLLPEIHASYEEGIYKKLNEKGYMNYDFFTPGLLIDAIENKDVTYLVRWIQEIIDEKIMTVNMLGCHDGIPVLDLKGLLPQERIESLINCIVDRGGYVKDLHGEKNVYYQVNATYFSALNEEESKLLLARAIQLFMPGISQIWYLDLFAGSNDYEAVKRAGSGGHKEINRTNLSVKEMEQVLKSNVIKEQIKLLKLRNTHKAFCENACCEVKGEGSWLEIYRCYMDAEIRLVVDFEELTYEVIS
ncbi:MAG: hypothetical protein J6A92_04665 [Lachnospiraceae bacterium]|nr:hypothetical protein [Lachnospiraceae bacterium]